MRSSKVALISRCASAFVLSALVCASAFAGTERRGSVSPMARSAKDNGAADGNLTLPHVRVYYSPSEAQSLALKQLLADQRTPSSPMYHKWLTPEEFEQRVWHGYGRNKSTGLANVARLSKCRSVEVEDGVFLLYFGSSCTIGISNADSQNDPSGPFTTHTLSGLPTAPNPMKRVVLPVHLEICQDLAPGDIATIYNTQPLLAAGIDGSAA